MPINHQSRGIARENERGHDQARFQVKDFGPTFSLPPCLWVPIAAVDVGSIERLVGKISSTAVGRKGRINAVLVTPYPRPASDGERVPIWKDPRACEFRCRLFPPRQVWVHVDFSGYRNAYSSFGLPAIPTGHFLDHVQNRECIRLRDNSHPYLRLCPVGRTVNTSGGHSSGGEGMEQEFLKSFATRSEDERRRLKDILNYAIQYADPMDLTKMLNLAPGTQTLPGVRDAQTLFYPA